MQFNDNVINQKRRPFIYADFWQYIDGYNDVIDFSSVPISLGTNMYQFVMFVKVMRNRLKDWNKKRPKHDDEIHKIQNQLEDIQIQLNGIPLHEGLNAD